MVMLLPLNMVGKSLMIYLKDGGEFYFKVTGAGPDYINGFDDERLNLRIDIKDIAFAKEA